MIYFFQKNRQVYSGFKLWGSRSEFRIRRIPHYDASDLMKFSYQIVSIWMLVIALRVGLFVTLPFSDITKLDLLYATNGVNLPHSNSEESLINLRLTTFVTIMSTGDIKVDGYEIAKEDLEKKLSMKKTELPNTIIGISAGKETEMHVINEIVFTCNKLGLQRIFFLTKKMSTSKNVSEI